MQVITLYRFPGRGREESGSGSASGNREQSQEQEDINISNPQQGDQWNNYQTRELSSSAEGNISEDDITEAFDEDE